MLVDSEVHRLRVENETLRERVRQLEETIASRRWLRITGLSLTRRDQAIVLALLTNRNEVSWERCRHAMDIAMDHVESGSMQAVKVAVCALRPKLRSLMPPVEIRTIYGQGLWLDPLNRARLEARWEDRPKPGVVPRR